MRMNRLLVCALLLAAFPLDAAQPPSACGERCLTVHGKKDADHALQFSTAYVTTAQSDDCVTYNRMAGVTTPQYKTEFMPPIRKSETTYRIEIPLTRHIGGKCGWKAVAVSFDVVSVASRREPPKTGMSAFGFGDAPATIARMDLFCRRSSHQRATGEQAAYNCLTDGKTIYPALGPGSHNIELNFGPRP